MCNNFDKFTLKIPRECLTAFNKDIFNSITSNKKGMFYVSSGLGVLGLNNIRVDCEKVVFTISGKVLLNDYPLLINKNTIEQAFKNLNKNNHVRFDINSSINRAEVLRLDVTKDVECWHGVQSYLAEMTRLARLAGDKYHFEQYKTGLVLRKKIVSYKSRLSLYDKYTELLQGKHRSILSYLSSEQVSNYKNVLRVERNYESLAPIRRDFGIKTKEIPLIEVLNSNYTPIFNFLNEFVMTTKEETLCSLIASL